MMIPKDADLNCEYQRVKNKLCGMLDNKHIKYHEQGSCSEYD